MTTAEIEVSTGSTTDRGSTPMGSTPTAELDHRRGSTDRLDHEPMGYAEVFRLMGLMTGDEKHTAAATSTLDVIWVLYDRILDVAPETVGDPGRDRFYLSKGHGPMAYYATLAAKGFIPEDWLTGWAGFDSPLGHHPGPQPGAGRRDLQRFAGARPPARGGYGARVARAGHRIKGRRARR